MIELMLGLLLAAAQPEVDLARRALSRELGVREDLIHFRSSRQGRWFDSSLGCPGKPERVRGVIRGVEISLEVLGRDYSVHVAGQRAVVCGQERPKPAIDPAAQKVHSLARADLAARLRISDGEIETRLVQSTVWPDSSLGCPKPGMIHAQVMTPGYLIELEAQGSIWSYHSDLQRATACEGRGPGGRLGPGHPAPGTGPVDR